MDPNMNKLFKWSVANSQNSQNNEGTENEGSAPNVAEASNGLTAEMINGLFGGPSDADQMKFAMASIENPEVDIENKLIAFDNFEQLIEGIDNAKNLKPLQLWAPLVKQLKHENAEIRLFAAWCIGTAVQNNPDAQDEVCSLSRRNPIISCSNTDIHQFILHNAMPTLVHIAKTDSSQNTRKKAVYAISSAVRNHQPAMNQLSSALPEDYPTNADASGIKAPDTETSDIKTVATETTAIRALDAEASDIKVVDATDMEAIDAIMDKLRSLPMDPST